MTRKMMLVTSGRHARADCEIDRDWSYQMTGDGLGVCAITPEGQEVKIILTARSYLGLKDEYEVHFGYGYNFWLLKERADLRTYGAARGWVDRQGRPL